MRNNSSFPFHVLLPEAITFNNYGLFLALMSIFLNNVFILVVFHSFFFFYIIFQLPVTLMQHLLFFSSPASLPWPTYMALPVLWRRIYNFLPLLSLLCIYFFSPNTLEDLSDSHQHFFQLCIEMK